MAGCSDTATATRYAGKTCYAKQVRYGYRGIFSEVGGDLLAYFSEYDPKLDKIRKELVITDKWSDQEFVDLSKRLKNYDYRVDIQNVDLEYLRNSLVGHRNFLLRLLHDFRVSEFCCQPN
ncbi:MAG: hypothetical protein JRI67_10720 [Deltaproteobacteria bacterium]|nr:hypothetical protein [Deltaproteobacteria bacterium]